jgi:hypothetical protein
MTTDGDRRECLAAYGDSIRGASRALNRPGISKVTARRRCTAGPSQVRIPQLRSSQASARSTYGKLNLCKIQMDSFEMICGCARCALSLQVQCDTAKCNGIRSQIIACGKPSGQQLLPQN